MSKEKDPKKLLIEFDLYIRTVINYLLAVEKEKASSRVKLAMLQVLGGLDMVDLLQHVGKLMLTGTPRRELNKVLEKGEYPIPRAEQLKNSFGKSDRSSSIDCNHAFFQFELEEETQKLLYAISPFGI